MKASLSVVLAIILGGASLALGVEPVRVQSAEKIEIRNLEAGRPYLTNRKYVIKRIPQGLSAMKFTAVPGNAGKDMQAKIPKGSTVYLALDSEKKTAAITALREYTAVLERDGWKFFGTIPVSDERMENLRVLVRTFNEDASVDFKGIGFVGSMIITSNLEVKAP